MKILEELAKTNRKEFNKIRRLMQAENRQRPVSLKPVDIDSIDYDGNKPIACWVSRKYLVSLYQENSYERITISRTEINNDGKWIDGITWDEIQAIKKEIGFGDYWALEVYPKDDCVINVANMRHLFIFKNKPSFAWSVSKDDSLVG